VNPDGWMEMGKRKGRRKTSPSLRLLRGAIRPAFQRHKLRFRKQRATVKYHARCSESLRSSRKRVVDYQLLANELRNIYLIDCNPLIIKLVPRCISPFVAFYSRDIERRLFGNQIKSRIAVRHDKLLSARLRVSSLPLAA
jgi:hypothetical protein